MPRRLRLAIPVLSTALLAPLSAQADVLYREVFPNRPSTSTLSQEANLYANGWYGGNSGDGFLVGQGGGEGGISTNSTAGAAELGAVNSNPQGVVSPNSSFGFFSKVGVSNNFFYTTEYSMALGAIQSFSWDSRHNTHTGNVAATGQGSAFETATHLLVQIGSNWYVSNTGVTQVGDNTSWHANSLNMSALSWALCTNSATPGVLPSCSITGGFNALPDGTVTGFGLWWLRGDGGNGRGTYRFDNFTIEGALPAPEPGTLALAGAALAACAAQRRRRSR